MRRFAVAVAALAVLVPATAAVGRPALDYPAPGRITVAFVDQDGEPAPGIEVLFHSSSGHFREVSGPDGRAVLDPAPGETDYAICWWAADRSIATQCWDDEPLLTFTTRIDLEERGDVRLDVETVPAARIVGTLRHSETGELVRANVTPEILVHDGWYEALLGTGAPVTVPGPGDSYDIGGLTPGTYRIEFAGGQLGWVEKWAGGAEREEDAATFTLGPGETRRFDATMVPSAQLVGQVTRPDGQPAQGVAVWAFRDMGGAWVPWDWVGVQSPEGFVLDRVPPGRYRLKYVYDAYDTQWWNGAPDLASATDVDVSTGDRVEGLNASLQFGEPDRHVNVSLPRILGEPVVGSELSYDPGSWQPTPSGYWPLWFIDGCYVTNADSLHVGPTAAGHTISLFVQAVGPAFPMSLPAPPMPTLGGYQDRCFPLDQAPVTSVRIPGDPVPSWPPMLPAPGWTPQVTSPQLLGRPVPGRRLRVGDLGQLPAGSVTTFRWFSDGEPIRGRHGRSLRLRPSLMGSRIVASVTITAPGQGPTVLWTQRRRVAS